MSNILDRLSHKLHLSGRQQHLKRTVLSICIYVVGIFATFDY